MARNKAHFVRLFRRVPRQTGGKRGLTSAMRAGASGEGKPKNRGPFHESKGNVSWKYGCQISCTGQNRPPLREFRHRSLLNRGRDRRFGCRRLIRTMAGLFEFCARRRLLLRHALSGVVATLLLAIALGSAESGYAQAAGPEGNTPATFQPEARKHISPKRPEECAGRSPLRRPDEELAEAVWPKVKMAPTRSSFLANWEPVIGATGYRLDVSASPSFNSYVSGYEHRDVGNVTSRIVGRLNPGTKYYYRVRPYNLAGEGRNSETMSEATTTASGLVINPTFDSSITSDPKSEAIQSTINQAIALYQPLFADSVTVEILFRYSDTAPDGTPIDGPIAQSLYVVYHIPWMTTFPTSSRTLRQLMTPSPTPDCRALP